MSQTELSFRRPSATPGGDGPTVLSVAQLVRGANRVLEDRYASVWVEGEVSNLKVGSSGHAFFTLKDDVAALPVAMWRANVEQLRFRLEHGMVLRVCGRLGIFPKQGRFQLYGERAEPAGLGALMLELQQRKAKLAGEGLFDAARKRPLPRWPRVIGLATSAHGAALHDMLMVARRRCPSHFVLAPAVVQGPDAPRSLCRALERLARVRGVDVIIVGRGGGSMEDLWAFNDERLARAVAGCTVPVVSAVGHEVDVTICDLVADVRAATPSQAAELAVPDCSAAKREFEAAFARLRRALEREVMGQRNRLDRAGASLARVGTAMVAHHRVRLAATRRALEQLHPRRRIAADRRRLELLRRRLDGAASTLARTRRTHLARQVAMLAMAGRRLTARSRLGMATLTASLARSGRSLAADRRTRLAHAAGALDALSPLAVLERGYAVIRTPSAGVITDSERVAVDDLLAVTLRRGSLEVRVTGVRPAVAEADPHSNADPHENTRSDDHA